MRREPQTLDTRLLGPFPSPRASLGQLPVQSVRPYTQTAHAGPTMPIQRTDTLTPPQRRHAFCVSVRVNFTYRSEPKNEMLEAIRCTQAWRTSSNARARKLHEYWLERRAESQYEQRGIQDAPLLARGRRRGTEVNGINRRGAGRSKCWSGLFRRLNKTSKEVPGRASAGW